METKPYNIIKDGQLVRSIEAPSIRKAKEISNVPVEGEFTNGNFTGMIGSHIWEIRPVFIPDQI